MTSEKLVYTFSEKILPAFDLTQWEHAILHQIYEDYENNINEIENFITSKKDCCIVEENPAVDYLNETVIPLLHQAMTKMLEKITNDNACYIQKSTLNGIDYLSEYLYNMNPKYPDRKKEWTYIFDVAWVKKFLDENPRPFYPLSLVWSRDFAAKRIQAFYRAHLQRQESDVQEIRQFWKKYKEKKRLDKSTETL